MAKTNKDKPQTPPSPTPYEALSQKMDEIAGQYEARFAGQPRQTRSLPTLARIIERTKEVLAGLTSLPEKDRAAGYDALVNQVSANLKIYQDEHTAIAEAQENGPEFIAAASQAGVANTIFGRYHRHFAGQSRATRDIYLMGEMIADLSIVRDSLARLGTVVQSGPFAEDLKLIDNSLDLYRKELIEIQTARKDLSREDEASVLATLANGQMKVYQDHFAGRSRLGRRPALLERVIRGMKEIGARMRALRLSGLSLSWNDQNIEIVSKNQAMYEKELQEIKKVREGTSLEDLLDHLGQEANEIFGQYEKGFAGKDRKKVDLAELQVLCDRLEEVGRQMRDLLRATESENGEENLEIVSSTLTSFEREYEQVQKAQKT